MKRLTIFLLLTTISISKKIEESNYILVTPVSFQGTESEDDFDYSDENDFEDTKDAEPDDELPPWEDGDNGDDEA